MDERTRTILERVETAVDQVVSAARSGDRTKARSVLVYWFGVLYDEGKTAAQSAPPLKETVAKLKAMNRRLSEQMPAAVDPEDSDDPA